MPMGDPPEDDQSDRVDLRHCPAPPAHYQGTRLPPCRDRDGAQTAGARPYPVACGERTLAAQVRARARFQDGERVERPDESRRDAQAALHITPHALTIP